MTKTIREMIFEAPEFRLLRAGEDSKANLRAAYDVARSFDKIPDNQRDTPDEMFYRTGKFIYQLIAELSKIAEDFYTRTGLTGGATGAASLADIQHLSEYDAQELFNVTYAQMELAIFKRDLIAAMVDRQEKNRTEKP